MKKNILILLILITLLIPSCIKKGKEKELKCYTDAIVNRQNQSIAQLDTFFQSLYFKDYDTKFYYQKTIDVNEENIKFIENIGPYKNNSLLYNAANNITQTIKLTLESEGELLLSLYDSVNEGKKWAFQHDIDSIIRQSINTLTEQQIMFDSLLTVFLDKYGFAVEMDTLPVSMQPKQVN